jgi:hypothetical protein
LANSAKEKQRVDEVATSGKDRLSLRATFYLRKAIRRNRWQIPLASQISPLHLLHQARREHMYRLAEDTQPEAQIDFQSRNDEASEW